MDPAPRTHLTEEQLDNYADYDISSLQLDNDVSYLPIRMESVIPQDIAGTEAPLYKALGPYFISFLFPR
jgi:hypothetical protein